jgi:SAM-dependent methyltransferase
LYLRGLAAGASEPPPPLAGASVLELGCGHGMPGVVAALAGAADVTFQDFNAEVLHALTAPCVAANLARARQAAAGAPPAPSPRLRFFSGDWGALPPLLPAASYDVVLSADTIYCTASQPRLLAAISAALRPGGCALVAAKNYYFVRLRRSTCFRARVAAACMLLNRRSHPHHAGGWRCCCGLCGCCNGMHAAASRPHGCTFRGRRVKRAPDHAAAARSAAVSTRSRAHRARSGAGRVLTAMPLHDDA